MKKEVVEFNKEKKSNGDILMEKKDLSGAYRCYIHDGDIAGLRKLAERLKEKGKKKDADAVLAKAHQLCNVEK
jgi:hypothetical protein